MGRRKYTDKFIPTLIGLDDADQTTPEEILVKDGGAYAHIASSALGMTIPSYDYVSIGYTNATTETYTFKTGGSGGTTVATVTLVYTDSTKESLSTVTKS